MSKQKIKYYYYYVMKRIVWKKNVFTIYTNVDTIRKWNMHTSSIKKN